MSMQRNSSRFAFNQFATGGVKLLRGPIRRWIRGAAGLAIVATLMGVSQTPQQSSPNADKPYPAPEANRLPDKGGLMQLHDGQSQKQQFETANTERKKQIEDDTAKLLELATELKAEVDKTSKDTLSINVIRKAESIEKLAKGVKDKMKLTAGAS
jgi:hypothetical protein